MSDFLSPGIYIEEVANGPQSVEAVGTSTMAIVGFTLQGPVDEATLVTSPDAYVRTFGGNTNKSLMPMSVSAFFNNGGTRAYVVRVVPSDALAASGCITDSFTAQLGATVSTGSPVTVTDTLAHPPAVAGTVVVTWVKTGTAITGENPVFAPAEDAVLLGPFVATLASEPLTAAVITLHWLEATVAKTATLGGTSTLGGANSGNLASASIDRTTGLLTITFAATHAPDANSITVDYTPAGATATVTDDGLGAFTDTGVAGTVDYTTGAVSIVFTGGSIVPYDGSTVSVTYTGCSLGLDAASAGLWGNDVRVTVSGNENFFTYGTPATSGAGAYTKFNVSISQENSSGVFELKETYEEVVFDDVEDPMYIVDAINQGSSLVTVTDNGVLAAPASFAGVSHLAESIGSGDGVTKTFTHTISSINRPVVKTSALVKYTIGAVAYTATCNSSGTISGTGIDATKTNTIGYTTGVITLNFLTAPDNATTVTVDYITMPVTTSANYDLTGGTDGTIGLITSLTVSNFAALKASKQGMYALDRVDEMMQLVIPDFAGDTTVSGDMIDYAEARRDLFCILTTPVGLSAQEAADYIRITLNKKSKYAAMYWPWVKATNPLSATQTLTIPAVGHIAGIYARTDNAKNVGKAPGGTVDGALRGITGLEFNPDKGDRDTVYPARINPLINTPQTGMAVWGVRTMSATNDAFKYVNATRLFIFVEKSTFNSTHNYVFESIGGNLYSSIKLQMDSFLLNLFNNGYFAGKSPGQAYQVVCDSTNNPPEVANAGQVIVDVSIAPNKPGEMIRFRFAQKTLS